MSTETQVNPSSMKNHVGIQDARNAAWTCDGKKHIDDTGVFRGYLNNGRQVDKDDYFVFCLAWEFADESKNIYQVALDRDKRVLDPTTDERRSSTTPCTREQFEIYLQFLQTGQRNYLQQLRGQLPTIY